MKVLGINTQHDGGCCLIIDGEVICAVSEERFTRERGAQGWWYSLFCCLERAQVQLSDIDLVVFSSYGDRLPKGFDGGLSALGLPHGRCAAIDHHLSHAASAFLLSPFEDALILVLDGSGNDGDTESYFIGERSEIERIGGNSVKSYVRGIGKTYEAFTSFLGWNMMDSGSTMALAAYGSPARFSGLDLFEIHGDQVNSRLREKYLQGVLRFAAESSVDFGEPFARGETDISCDVARFVQDRTEEAMIELVSRLITATGKRRICFAGGVALNCVANEKVRRRSGAEEVFIVPAASDKGQALGNALFGYCVLMKGGRPKPLSRDSFGKCYSDLDILQVLERRQELGNNFIVKAPPIEFTKTNRIETEAARLVAAGNTVGWFQGGSELGSRALGHRSILADPRSLDIKTHLNAEVKRRAWFRPYAPTVLDDAADRYFELDGPSPFMLFAPMTRPEKARLIPGVVHVDGTSRPQTISSDSEPSFWKLVSEFYALTEIPLVLNTSFNISGEPIVETPKDAVSAFLRSGLDYLVLEDYLVWKRLPPWEKGQR